MPLCISKRLAENPYHGGITVESLVMQIPLPHWRGQSHDFICATFEAEKTTLHNWIGIKIFW